LPQAVEWRHQRVQQCGFVNDDSGFNGGRVGLERRHRVTVIGKAQAHRQRGQDAYLLGTGPAP
jgi:hypothetical protein